MGHTLRIPPRGDIRMTRGQGDSPFLPRIGLTPTTTCQFVLAHYVPYSFFIAALAYARARRAGLEVDLDYPVVAIDTNHLERAARVIAMARKNW